MRLTIASEQGTLVEAQVLKPSAGTITTSIDGLAPGAYSVDVGGTDEASAFAAVSSDVLVWADPGEG
ncbi:MAG: hypothetical protein ACRDOU_21165 [Streptosporangiaceae bacterium]